MKFKTLLFISTIIANSNLFAQNEPKFYVKAGAEYAMPIMGEQGFDAFIQYNNNAITQSYDIKNASFGKGLWASLHVGYYFTSNFGVDVGADIGLSNPQYIFKVDDGTGGGEVIKTKTKRPFLINPSLVYRLPFKNLSILGKTGIVIPMNTTLNQTKTGILTSSARMEAETRNRFALGFSCGIGAEYRIARKFGISLEANVVALKTDSKETEVTSFIVDGIETIDWYSKDSRKTYYESKITRSSNNKTAPFEVSYSRLGLKLGFAFYL
ncbi:MAG: outer membrane beta-barrel protein [Taibaiella sp.]|jgi:hypothetical protein